VVRLSPGGTSATVSPSPRDSGYASLAPSAIVSGMTRSPDTPPPVLLAVRDVREEIRAGLGQTSLTVRTLDGVTLQVHAGELVVLRGGVASGASSLLAALSGARRVRTGHRRLARGVQVRRACISSAAFSAIAAAWAQPQPAASNQSQPLARARVVYLFRVRAGAPGRPTAVLAHDSTGRRSAADASVWGVWAESLRAHGGSIVAHVADDRLHDPRPYAPSSRYPHAKAAQNTSPAVHEATAGDRRSYPMSRDASTERPRHRPRGTMRTLTLAAGRIVSADPVTHPTWSHGSGDS
jgi:energy-coupling factor transporter ATP-binding protein EcfA2